METEEKNEFFHFKRFSVRHSRSSMKIGVDAVLLGCWTAGYPNNILDVGTGCGIISLILAQRFPQACIEAIDIDDASIEEASLNFRKSPWNENMMAKKGIFPDDIINKNKKYDLIISNPPFFKSGIINPITSREKARHQDSLSPFSLLKHAADILNFDGKLAMIFPKDQLNEIAAYATCKDWSITRIAYVRNDIKKTDKRILAEFQRLSNSIPEPEIEEIILFCEQGPTEKYRHLCKDFYLKF